MMLICKSCSAIET